VKKIVVLSNASSYGGAERSLETIIPALAKRYHISVVVENRRHQDRLERLGTGVCEVLKLAGGTRPHEVWHDLRTVRRHLIAQNPSVVIANANKAALFAAVLGYTRLRPPPNIMFVRDFQWQYRRWIFRLARKARVVVPNPAVLESPYWAGILNPVGVSTIPNAVVAEMASLSAPEEKPPVVLCLANISRWKGIDLLIRAFARATRETTGMRLVIAGHIQDPQYWQECQSLAAQLGVMDSIDFLAFAEDTTPLFQAASMVIVSSVSKHGGPETFGRTVIEAWSHHKPVVAFGVGGPKHLIRSGIDGFLVAEGDIEEMANCMVKLWVDRSFAKRLGANGFARTAQEFSPQAVAGQVAMVIDSLTGEAA
jgi:glycosyltransferase involved in cell wall biosynthesis